MYGYITFKAYNQPNHRKQNYITLFFVCLSILVIDFRAKTSSDIQNVLYQRYIRALRRSDRTYLGGRSKTKIILISPFAVGRTLLIDKHKRGPVYITNIFDGSQTTPSGALSSDYNGCTGAARMRWRLHRSAGLSAVEGNLLHLAGEIFPPSG